MKGLPTSLRVALTDAELDDPVVLRSYPRASAERLGVHEGGRRAHVLGQTVCSGVAVGDTTGLDGVASPTVDFAIMGFATMGTATIDTVFFGQLWAQSVWEALSRRG